MIQVLGELLYRAKSARFFRGKDIRIANDMSGAIDTISAGYLARTGLLDEPQDAADLVERTKRDGIETLRIVFADQHGILRGKTITQPALVQAFASGLRIPSTLLLKDLSHRTVFPVWSENGNTPFRGAGDLLLVPLPRSYRPLPWSPHSALIQCDIVQTDGRDIGFAPREILQRALDLLATEGLHATVGLEVEFQVFEVTDPALGHRDTTMPARPPETRALNQGYQYLTETRYDAAEELLDLLRRTAQALGMPVRSVEIEMGPSQFEFTFDASDPMTIADMAVTFRTMVKEVCQRHGLLASFMAKPKLANAAANGWHIHQSITDLDGRNLFVPGPDGGLTEAASGWVAGLLDNAAACCVMTTPTVNGYKRYCGYQLAPDRIGWGFDNRGAMIRALTAPGEKASRIENRCADSAANPYYALASQIAAGLSGMVAGEIAPAPLTSPYDDHASRLPSSLIEAIDAFANSVVLRRSFGSVFVDYMEHLKREEWTRYMQAVSDWEQQEYFTVF